MHILVMLYFVVLTGPMSLPKFSFLYLILWYTPSKNFVKIYPNFFSNFADRQTSKSNKPKLCQCCV